MLEMEIKRWWGGRLRGTLPCMSSMTAPLFLDAARVVDGAGSVDGLEARVAALTVAGVGVRSLEIDSARVPWRGRPDRKGPFFQSGCAPILALARARELLANGEAEAVVIRGDEPLRTGYGREERRRLLRVYEDVSVPEAYTALARLQMARLGLGEAAYRRLADGLLDNYARAARRRGLPTHLAHGDRAATDLFRYADCADPNVDFRGAVLLGSKRAADALDLDTGALPRLLSAAVELTEDGPDHLASIVGYDHLGLAYERACEEAEVDFAARFFDGEALLEAYTCFPPAPLGLLLAAGLASDGAGLEQVLALQEITVTGGMNLAKAPWNNPALHGLIVLWELLREGAAPLGLVHGNGGVGGYQGVAILALAPRG